MNTTNKGSVVLKGFLAATVIIGVGIGGNALAQSSSTASGSMAPYCGPQRVVSPGLYRGLRGSNVMALQQFLASLGYLNVSATGYFGPLTYGALVAFQAANSLPATGYFGSMSHAVFLKRCPPGPTPTGNVRIDSIAPASGPVDTEVTITGNNFTDDNTIHFGNGVIMHVPRSISSTMEIQCFTTPCYPIQTITFMVPASLDPACLYSTPSCLMPSQQTTPGTYQVYVTNGNGTSNIVTFTVLGGTTTHSPRIDSIQPSRGSVGSTVTLMGANFSPDMIVRFAEGSVQGAVRSDGKSITFTVPDGVSPYCGAPGMYCAEYFREVTPGDYKVYVQNPDGTVVSNAVTFTVTGATTGRPRIYSVVPQSAREGASVTINGSGFSAGSAVVHFYQNGAPYGTMGGVTVASNSRIMFTVPEWIGEYCHPDMACNLLAKSLPPGSYTIAVETTNGISNQASFTKTTGGTTSGTISIAGIDAPSMLAAGATGIWTVRVNVSSAHPNLRYSVVWGDEETVGSSIAPWVGPPQTSASFTHSYNAAGTYRPTFTVTDDAGHSATVSATVTVMSWYY